MCQQWHISFFVALHLREEAVYASEEADYVSQASDY